MTENNPMRFFSDNVDAWGPLEWFDRLAKAVHARSRSVSEKDDLSFELYQNIASSSATRLVTDFEGKVRMALATLRELEKANVAYVDANTALIRENEALKKDRYDLAYAITGGEDAPGLLDSVPTSQLVDIARDTHSSHSADIDRAIAAEDEVKRLTAPVTIACRCTKIAQDETCPVGYPSLLCETCDGKGVLPYVELDGPELWEIVFGVNDDVAGEITDEQYDQIAKAINDVFISPLHARQALASTGGEHNAE